MRSLTIRWAVAAAGIWIVAGAVAAPPDEPVRVDGSDPSVSGSFLRPYTNRWRFFIEKPGSAPVEAGTWSDRMETTTYRGRPALRRTQVAEYERGPRLTFVNVFDPKAMASLTFDYVRADTGETRHLEIDGEVVSFRRQPGTGGGPPHRGSDGRQDYVARVDRKILDYYDGLYGILLDAFPLREGYEVEFAAFDTDRACLDWVHLGVSGRETVPAGEGRTADTWVVRVETELYGSSTWWLTREAPYVIKARLVLAEKDGGAVITYSMI